jgi:PAS domain-containing protein
MAVFDARDVAAMRSTFVSSCWTAGNTEIPQTRWKPLNVSLNRSSIMLDGILILDDRGTCLEANPAAQIMCGARRDELVGQSIGVSSWKRSLDRRSGHSEMRVRRGDGKTYTSSTRQESQTFRKCLKRMAGTTGLEPAASAVTERRQQVLTTTYKATRDCQVLENTS